MAFVEVNINSERAAKARITRLLRGPWVALCRLLFWVMLVSGVAILILGYSAGWLVASLAIIPFMLYQWHDGDLKQLPPAKGDSIDSILEAGILAELPEHATPLQIAEIVGRVQSGQFMAVRLGITANLLTNIASKDVKMTDDLWEKARQIQRQTDSRLIHGGVIAAAILQQSSHSEALLAQMHMDMEDVLGGVIWYNRLQTMVDSGDRPRRTGGVARDWSFGYTPLLDRFGVRLGGGKSFGFDLETDQHKEIINQLIDTFGAGGRQNVALVGPTGVGKTSILHSFADRILDASADIPSSLKFRQVFLLDSSALISAAPGRGELEGLVMRALGEAYGAKNIIICLDNAQLLRSPI